MAEHVVLRNRVLPLREPVRSSRPKTMALRDLAERRVLLRMVVTLAVAAAVVGGANVALRLRVAELGYQLAATQEAIERLELEHRELRARVALSDDPERLLHLARVRLGLFPPAQSQKVVLP